MCPVRFVTYVSGRSVRRCPNPSFCVEEARMGQTKKLIDCHDCDHPVSPSASACPNCGSKVPFGPPVLHRKRPPIYNIEARNDRNMVVFAVTLGGLGAAYGFATSAGPLSAALLVTSYGMLGVLAGVPLAALFNITRRLWR